MKNVYTNDKIVLRVFNDNCEWREEFDRLVQRYDMPEEDEKLFERVSNGFYHGEILGATGYKLNKKIEVEFVPMTVIYGKVDRYGAFHHYPTPESEKFKAEGIDKTVLDATTEMFGNMAEFQRELRALPEDSIGRASRMMSDYLNLLFTPKD